MNTNPFASYGAPEPTGLFGNSNSQWQLIRFLIIRLSLLVYLPVPAVARQLSSFLASAAARLRLLPASLLDSVANTTQKRVLSEKFQSTECDIFNNETMVFGNKDGTNISVVSKAADLMVQLGG